MDLDAINQFRLLKEDLSIHKHDDRYWFKEINSVDDDPLGLQKVIDFHHEDLDWDATPDLEEVQKRINFGSFVQLNMYEDKVIGWNWTNPKCVTIDWKSFYQPLKSNELYIGGGFFTRKHRPFPNSAIVGYRQGFEHYLNYHKKDTIYLYSDNWNRASAMLCYKCGFTKYTFLNENSNIRST